MEISNLGSLPNVWLWSLHLFPSVAMEASVVMIGLDTNLADGNWHSLQQSCHTSLCLAPPSTNVTWLSMRLCGTLYAQTISPLCFCVQIVGVWHTSFLFLSKKCKHSHKRNLVLDCSFVLSHSVAQAGPKSVAVFLPLLLSAGIAGVHYNMIPGSEFLSGFPKASMFLSFDKQIHFYE